MRLPDACGAGSRYSLPTPAGLRDVRFDEGATADVSLRRLQRLKVAPGATVHWTFGTARGEVKADAQGVVTIPALKITAEPTTLSVKAAK